MNTIDKSLGCPLMACQQQIKSFKRSQMTQSGFILQSLDNSKNLVWKGLIFSFWNTKAQCEEHQSGIKGEADLSYLLLVQIIKSLNSYSSKTQSSAWVLLWQFDYHQTQSWSLNILYDKKKNLDGNERWWLTQWQHDERL